MPRNAFGRTKKAITQPLWNTEALHQLMAPRSYCDFAEFVSRLPLSQGRLDTIRLRSMRLLYEANRRINWRLMRIARALGIPMTEKWLVGEHHSRDVGPSSFTFHWGVWRTLPRYSCDVSWPRLFAHRAA